MERKYKHCKRQVSLNIRIYAGRRQYMFCLDSHPHQVLGNDPVKCCAQQKAKEDDDDANNDNDDDGSK